MNMFQTGEKYIVKIEYFILILLMLIILFTIIIQVVARYVLYLSTPWAEEIARYGYIWLSYLGASTAIATRGHIDIDIVNTILERKLSKEAMVKAKVILSRMSLVFTMAFLLAFGKVYLDYLIKMSRLGPVSPGTGISMLIPMSSVIVGTVLMIYHAVCRYFFELSGMDNLNMEERN